MKLLIVSIILLSVSAYATCVKKQITCLPTNGFQNQYAMETVSCAPPGGPATVTKVFTISNPLTHKCSPVGYPGCAAPMVKITLNQRAHNKFHAELKEENNEVYIKISDNRAMPQGRRTFSTPNQEFMLLHGYKCRTRVD